MAVHMPRNGLYGLIARKRADLLHVVRPAPDDDPASNRLLSGWK